MIRLSRALKGNSATAVTFVSLIALLACGTEDPPARPAADPPPFRNRAPQVTLPINPASANASAAEPLNTQLPAPVGATPSNEVSGEIPLEPAAMNDDEDDGEEASNAPMTPEPPPAVAPPAVPPTPVPPAAAPPGFVENSGAGCATPQFPSADALPSITGLPDPFTKIDGTRISTRAEWRCRRQEIKELAEQYIFGDKPGRPQSVTGSVTNQSITVNVSNQGQSTSFSVSVQLPNAGSAPYPALVSVGEFTHSDLVQNEGVAIINFDPNAIANEQAPRDAKAGAFYDIYGAQSFTGALLAWSWGVSRILDVIEQSGGNVIRADAIAVAGCSRNGKGAFAIGAFDERIALTIPFESGSGGVPIWRGIPGEGAQSPSSAWGETYWLGDAFGSFINDDADVTRLPVDTHEVVAMVAPRGLLILDNPYIANLGPESAHVAALAGAEVFRALGAGGNISYHSAVASGTHCEARPEHREPLRQALRKFLLRTGNAAGSITADAATTGNLAEWRNWTTPTLN